MSVKAHFFWDFGARNKEDTLAPNFSPLDLCTKVGNYLRIHKLVRCTQLAPNQKEKRGPAKKERKKTVDADE